MIELSFRLAKATIAVVWVGVIVIALGLIYVEYQQLAFLTILLTLVVHSVEVLLFRKVLLANSKPIKHIAMTLIFGLFWIIPLKLNRKVSS